MKFDLDPHKIADLVLKVYPHGLPPVQERRAVYIAPADGSIVNAATRWSVWRNPVTLNCWPHL
jgi:hypothetical protein